MSRALTGFAIRRPVVVLLIWTAVLVAGFGVGIGVFARLVPDIGTVPGSESTRATERLDAAAPEPGRLTAVISGRSSSDPALLADVRAAIAAVRALPGVASVTGPAPSATGQALLVSVTLSPGKGAGETAQAAAERLRAVAAP